MIFEGSFAELKPSVALRNSNRRKLKKRIAEQYKLVDPEVVDALAPEGTRSALFTTSTGMTGTIYIASASNFNWPLWFTLENAEDDLPGDLPQMLMPTLHTLTKCPQLLPTLSVADQLLPAIQRGGTLGLADVLSSTTDRNALESGSLVNIRDVAVGRMVVHGSELGSGHEGAAVEVIHAVGDALHKMGSGTLASTTAGGRDGLFDNALANVQTPSSTSPSPSLLAESLPCGSSPPATPNRNALPLSPKEVDGILHTAVLIAIRSFPLASLPITASLFYSTHILPSRPAEPTLSTSTPVDIKHSSFKSLAAFLRTHERDGLLTLKTTRNGEMITKLSEGYRESEQLHLDSMHTVAKAQEDIRRNDEEERSKLTEAKMMKIQRLWQPVGATKAWFETLGADSASFYSEEDLDRIFDRNDLASERSATEGHLIDVPADSLIRSALDHEKDRVGEQCSRGEAIKRLQRHMELWHSINGNLRQGVLEPIRVASVMRRRAKQVTLVTKFEPFGIDGKSLAEELKPLCAGSTSVNLIPDSGGKLWEIMVQCRQLGRVVDVLMARGVPREWIETEDLIEK